MSLPKKINHFAPILLDARSGMGRVAVHWREAFIRSGWDFQHFGTAEVPMPLLKPLWANSARKTYFKSGRSEGIHLVHEPSAEILRQTSLPTILFSHGLEERCVELAPSENYKVSKNLKSMFSKPFWLRQAWLRTESLRKCPLLLLINQDDRNYAISRYGRQPEDIFVFRNGVNASALKPQRESKTPTTILFYGSWLERKGKTVLIDAASKLASAGIRIRWLLVGTGKTEFEVLSDWPLELRSNVVIYSKVTPADDDSIYEQATLFVLPSYYEGQPLTLLQAMESGCCVITTRCCGQKDIIRHGHNGFLVEPGSSDQLADMIAKALANDEMRLKIAFQAKADMASRRWSTVADEVVAAIEQFMHKVQL